MAWFLPAVGAVAVLLGREVVAETASTVLGEFDGIPSASELLVRGFNALTDAGDDEDGDDLEEEEEEEDE